MARTLYIIDGHAQIFRAYFAIRGGMSSPVTGEPTHAVFAFAGMMLQFFEQLKPELAVMAIDMPGPTFRDELDPQYKAQRDPPPADFFTQEKRIFEMVRLFGIPVIGQPGAEADDLIATFTQRALAAADDVDIRIVSKDKDLEQLLSDRVQMFDIHTGKTITPQTLLEEKGITPAQVVDLLALTGDKVDNIPGIDGVGNKTAALLLQQYGSIAGIYDHLSEIKGKRQEKLAAGRDRLPLNLQLVKLKDDVDVPFALADAQLKPVDRAGLTKLFRDMGFRRHISDLERLLGVSAPAESTAKASSTPPAEEQGTLFQTSLFDSVEAAPDAADAPVETDLHTAQEYDYDCITTAAQLDELVATLQQQTLIAVDTETVGLGHRAALCGISLAWREGHGVYIPTRAPAGEAHLDEATVLAALTPVLLDRAIGKCGHNLKYDLLVLRHAGVRVRGVVFDSLIAAHLLNLPERGLDDLARSLLGHQTIPISRLIGEAGRGMKQRTMDSVPLAMIAPYAAEDADVSLRFCLQLREQLAQQGMTELAQQVEMPLVEVLAEMEFAGIRVQPDVLMQQKEQLNQRIVELRDAIYDAAGGPFNLDSPKQLAEVLFTQMGLPVIKRNKTGPSTDIEVLEKLADMEGLPDEQAKLPRLIVEYRQLSKLVNTYLDNLRDSIHADSGRVHASFHQTGAATGRLSSSGPNLQNIPIRTEVGRQIRKAFVAAPGQLLISADYSQIELRVLAHFSQDEELLKAFRADQDIHAAVAAQVFGVAPDAVTGEQRSRAKVINFGIIYGITAFGLSRRIEQLSKQDAQKLIDDYRRRFPGIDRFLAQCIAQAEEHGYVTTILGRRRPIREITGRNPQTRALGERLAINTVVQGSAADLIKLAMVKLQNRIDAENLPLRILLQIHDELVVETPAEAAPQMAEVVRQEMETALELGVPLKVETGVGGDWLAAK